MNQNTQNTPRESMVFYRSFYSALSHLSSRKREAALSAIIEYGLNGTEPTSLDATVEVAFSFAKPLIDKANERYSNCIKNGKKGGRPKSKNQETNQGNNQEENQGINQISNQKHNLTLNLNDNDNDNVNVNINDNDNENENINVNENNNDTENVYVNENTKKRAGRSRLRKNHTR